ncbi:MAG: hypothetical protein ACM3SY_19345 [Candidatus Omnitrophota bacterium]
MDEIQVLYFLEDRAQENFIKSLVERIAGDVGITNPYLKHDIRSARGGSIIIKELEKFVKGYLKYDPLGFNIIIVAIDGNCKGYQKRKKELQSIMKEVSGIEERLVFAVPDPHIERWYMLDQKAFRKGVGINKSPDLPAYKCQRDHYKKIIYQTLHDANVNTFLGGTEYADRIVANIENLELLCQRDDSFKFFVQELKRALRKQ